MSGRLTVLLVSLLTVVGGVGSACRADAHTPFTPDLTISDLADMARALSLDSDQRTAIASRISRFDEAFGGGVIETRRRMSSLRATLGGPDDDWDEAIRRAQAGRIRIIGEWTVEAGGLRDALVNDILALLTDEQRARWPAFDRRLRRDRTLGRGRLAGESLDLLRIASEIEPAPTPALAARLDAYAADLDAVLRLRNALPIDTSFAPRADDGSGALEREIAARKAVRDVNLAQVETIAAALSPEAATAFRDRAHRAAFPRVYRPTSIEVRLRNATERTELDETQRAAVEGLANEYVARLAAMRDHLREVIVRSEPDVYRHRLHRELHAPLESPNGTSGTDPILDAFAERAALDEEISLRLRRMLTPEQAIAVLGGSKVTAHDDDTARRTTVEKQAWVMERFDEDGDGRLADDELDALRAFLRDR